MITESLHTEKADWSAPAHDLDLNLHVGYDLELNDPPTVECQIKEIMTWFDFDKTLQAMNSVHWVWAGVKKLTINGLKEQAKHGLESVAKRGHGSFWSCGGFRTENVAGRLKLFFVVSDWEIEEQ